MATGGETMKAAVLFKPNEPLQVVDCELDPPKAGEVRVKMKASGVCQSDWHVMNGDWPSPLPIVPGHEAAGEIAECGPGGSTGKPRDGGGDPRMGPRRRRGKAGGPRVLLLPPAWRALPLLHPGPHGALHRPR